MEKPSNPHTGHRARLKERFRQEGLEHFEDHTALELLLFYAIPRQDTNELAHTLLARFGSLGAVLNATEAELLRVPGIGPNAASLLRLVSRISLRCLQQEADTPRVIHSSADAYAFLQPRYLGQRDELSFLLCLDAKNKLVFAHPLFRGSFNAVQVSVRKIVEHALLHNAAAVILAHNHPSGVALPSQEDYQTTLSVQRALQTVGVELRDHIILADGDYVSLADSGFFLV